MRTLLAGELAQAQDPSSDYYVKLEVQNGSGTWIDVGALLGNHWIVNATWGEVRDTPVGQATFTLVQRVGSASLAPLMSASVLNVDDTMAYSPLLDIGRLVRASTATMPHGVALDVTKYRPALKGRIDNVESVDSEWNYGPITILCSDLGAWLMDLQIETEGIEYGNPTTPPTLESVVQAIINANIPVGEPAVTLVKQSTSNFAVTGYKQGATKLLEGIQTIVLDSTGEDVRYRFDASHVSQLMWFNPDRSRVTVDATFIANRYVMRRLDLALADIRNAGSMAYIDSATGISGTVTAVDTLSIADYRRRFFRLPSSKMLTTVTEAQTVIDAVVNDLSGPPAESSAELPFCWFVQLYDRYTFQADGRQYDQDQTFAVSGYQHTIENSRGSTVLTLTARIVGAYAAWHRRLPFVAAAPPVLSASFDAAGQLIINSSGVPGTVSQKIAWATGSTPSVATVRAATPIAQQNVSGLATGSVYLAGTVVYIAALAYNAYGLESTPLAAISVSREGSGSSRPPVPIITPTNAETDNRFWSFQLDEVPGSGGAAASNFVLSSKIGQSDETTIYSGAGTLFPFSLDIGRALGFDTLIRLLITDTATGLSATANLTVPARWDGSILMGTDSGQVAEERQRGGNGGIPVPGGVIQAVSQYDSTGSVPLIDSGTRRFQTALGGPTGIGGDIIERGGNKGDQAIDSGYIILPAGVDFTRSYTNKHLGNMPDDGTSDRRAATLNQKTGGDRGFGAIDSGNIVVTTAWDGSRAYTGKHLGNIPDDGTSDRRASTANQKTGGDRGFGAIDSGNVVVAAGWDGSRAYTGKHLGNIPDDGTSDRRASTANEKTGGGRGFSAIDSGISIVASAIDMARSFVGKHLGNIPDDGTSDRRAATLNQKTGGDRGAAAIDSGNIVVAAAWDGARAYTGKHLGNFPDDATSDRRAATANQKTGGDRGFTGLDSSSYLQTGVTTGATAADGVAGIESGRGATRKGAFGAGMGAGGITEEENARTAAGGYPVPGARYDAQPQYDATGSTLLLDPATRRFQTALSGPTGIAGDIIERGGNKGDQAIDGGYIVLPAGVDFTRSYTNKHLGNMPDDGTSDRRAATLNQKTGGDRGFGALDSGNVAVAGAVDFSRAYTGKHLGNVPDDGTSDRRAATINQKTGGDRGYGALDSGNIVVASAWDGARAYTGKHLGNIPDDGTSDRRASTANQKTGGDRGLAAIDSGNIVVAAGVDFSRSYTGKSLANVPDDATSDRRAATANQKTGGDRAVVAINSDNMVGNVYSMAATTVAGIRSYQTSQPLSISYVAGSNTWTINIAGHTLKVGTRNAVYNSGSVAGLNSFNSGYYIYADDPTLAGGAVTYQAVLDNSPSTLASANGRYYVGWATIGASGGGGTPPAPTGGGGGKAL